MILPIGQCKNSQTYDKWRTRNSKLETAEGGFTLIEMMVVIVIVGILTIFTVPYFGGFANRTKLDTECRTWMAYANYARAQAVINGVIYQMTCDLDQQTYALTYLASSTDINGQAGQFVSSNNQWGQVVSVDSSLRMASIQWEQNPPQQFGQVTILFTPDGTTSNIIATFQDSEQDTRQIDINALTGLAQIQSDTTIPS